MIKFSLVLLIFSSLTSIPLTAQSDFVILTNGDSLFGSIDRYEQLLTKDKHFSKIRLTNQKGKRKKYAPSEIQEIGIGHHIYRKFRLQAVPELNILTNHYQIVDFGGNEKFLEVVTEGPVSMYYYYWVDGMDDQPSRFPLLKKANEDVMARATQGIFGLKKKVLSSFFSDCPDLKRNLSNGDFKKPQEVVTFYNTQCEK